MTPQQAFSKVQFNPNEATRVEFMLAMSYLHERLNEVERVLGERNRAFTPPTAQEVEEYAKTIKFDLSGQAFCDYYEARNWMLGKTKMKSWKAAIRTWKSRRDNDPTQKPTGRTPDNLRDDHGL